MKKLISVMMFIFVIATCNGCVVKDIISNISAKFYNPNIWEYGEGQWICEELNLEFTYISYESQEEAESTAGTIVKDGEVIDIVCAFSYGREVVIFDRIEHDTSIANHGGIACDPILVIEYKFEDKDAVATATVTQDRLFDGEYLEKEVTLKKVEIE